MYQATYNLPTLSNQIGWEYMNPAWNLTDPLCEGVTLCTVADALMVKYSNDANAMPRISKTDLPVGVNNATGSIEADWYISTIYAAMTPYVGLVVDKIGRTTGWTRGTVTQTCAYANSNGLFAGSQYYTERVLCHDVFSNASAGFGDSGSPVFYKVRTNDALFLVGMLYAREGTAYGPAPDARCTAGCLARFVRWDRLREHFGYPPMTPTW